MKEIIHDAEGTGINSGDFFSIFNHKTIKRIQLEIRDEETGMIMSASADIVTEAKGSTCASCGTKEEPKYTVIGFVAKNDNN